MHEFHAWVGLAESTSDDDGEKLVAAVSNLEQVVREKSWHDARFDLRNLNGRWFLTATGFVNRRREEGDQLEVLLSVISRELPGSWGLVYERDDEALTPPGPNAFRVRVLARGVLQEQGDPFLSPCNPAIED